MDVAFSYDSNRVSSSFACKLTLNEAAADSFRLGRDKCRVIHSDM